MGNESGIPIPEEKLNLDRLEIEALLNLFVPADWVRAQYIANSFCKGLSGWESSDLLHEAIIKLYEGSRRWPRGEHPLVVLKTAMHSISSNLRKRSQASPIDANITIDPSVELGAEVTPVAHGKIAITPEDYAVSKQQLDAVYATVSGDEDLEFLIIVWADRLRGEEAMRELGWDEKRYDAARKRLNRRLRALESNWEER
jgi:hypothetical protein